MGERLKDLSETIPLNSPLKSKSDQLGTSFRSLSKLRKSNVFNFIQKTNLFQIEGVKLNLYETIDNFFKDVSLVVTKTKIFFLKTSFFLEN